MSVSHGPKISSAEYTRRMNAIERSRPKKTARPDPQQGLALLKDELYTNIDYRLGVNFPSDRRQQVWDAHQKVYRQRWLHLLVGFIKNPTDPNTGLLSPLVSAYNQVLTDQEIKDLLDLSAADLHKLKKSNKPVLENS